MRTRRDMKRKRKLTSRSTVLSPLKPEKPPARRMKKEPPKPRRPREVEARARARMAEAQALKRDPRVSPKKRRAPEANPTPAKEAIVKNPKRPLRKERLRRRLIPRPQRNKYAFKQKGFSDQEPIFVHDTFIVASFI